MDENTKINIIADFLVAEHNRTTPRCADSYEKAKEIIRLVRTLDNYRERDEHGKFVKKV